MLCRVDLVRTDVSAERIASIIRMSRIVELRTTVALISSVLRLLVAANVVPNTPIFVALMMEALRYAKTSVLKRDTRCHIPEYGILYSRHPEISNLTFILLRKYSAIIVEFLVNHRDAQAEVKMLFPSRFGAYITISTRVTDNYLTNYN
jgi:hypothetical protein